MIGHRSFADKASEELHSSRAAKLYGGLGVIISITQFAKRHNIARKLKFNLVSNYNSILHKFDASNRVAIMSVKLYRIV